MTVPLPVRAVVATDLTYLRQVGYVANPRINFDWPLEPAVGSWNIGLTAGPLYADKGFNAYYYSVAPAYATAERPAYTASGGYAGFQMTTSIRKRFEKTWFGAFLRADDLRGAAFEDSPLARRGYSIMAGCAFSVVLDASIVRVTADE